MTLKLDRPILKIDKPHDPYGAHVDHIQRIPGVGAEKMRFNDKGDVISHELILKGGKKFNI